ncbi:anti-sigma factor domain-containing protein [Oryzobacter telluris]|uniref:anti-sigma factor n=1 Tax=Oryzobacter telluris TaxID=3149179 RepID=UPI00370DC908
MSPDLHHLSGAYAVDALDTHERTSFEEHLAVCPDCRAEVAELTSAAHALSSLDEAIPPPALRASVLAGISRVRPLPPLDPEVGGSLRSADVATTSGGPRRERRSDDGVVVPFRRRTATWLTAAAAAVAVAVGGLAWSPWSDPTSSPYDQVVAAADATTVTSAKGGTTAKVVYSRQLGRSAITVAGLPSLPDDQTYQLWYAGLDEKMHPAGLFDTDASGRATAVLDGDANTATAVGLTVEPAGGSAQPTTEPLMVMALA